MTAPRYTSAGACVSACGRYRYALWRTWDAALPPLVFVMLNPSTADGREDDPTVRSCVRLARALGFGGIIVVNQYGWRATEPADLPAEPARARGPGNAAAVRAALRRGPVVCAWGATKVAARGAPGMIAEIARYKRTAYSLGCTKSGAPRHPLFVPADMQLEIYWRRTK